LGRQDVEGRFEFTTKKGIYLQRKQGLDNDNKRQIQKPVVVLFPPGRMGDRRPCGLTSYVFLFVFGNPIFKSARYSPDISISILAMPRKDCHGATALPPKEENKSSSRIDQKGWQNMLRNEKVKKGFPLERCDSTKHEIQYDGREKNACLSAPWPAYLAGRRYCLFSSLLSIFFFFSFSIPYPISFLFSSRASQRSVGPPSGERGAPKKRAYTI
jgi:hypothetical protein